MDQVKNCGRQPLENLKGFKGCLPQILLGRFFNTLSHMKKGTMASQG